MRKSLLPLSFTFLFAFFASFAPLPNGSTILAQWQLDAATKKFNDQELLQTLRLASFSKSNNPGQAASWLLLGHCFYLMGQDKAAMDHYSAALRRDPHAGPIPASLREFHQASAPPALSEEDLASLRQKIGQMIMVSVPGTKLSERKKEMLQAGWIGGVILFNQNIKTKDQVRRYVKELQANSPTPLFVAVDQEGGEVRRLKESQGFKPLPSLATLGQTQNPVLAYRFGLLSGEQLRTVGANLNLAPVVDIDRGIASSVISKYQRSLGRDPEWVSTLAQQIVRGMRKEKIIATAKHFPTQSVTSADTHAGAAVADIPLGELETKDFLPYKNLIQAGLLDAVMLSHIIYKSVDPYFPASLSSEMIQSQLRRKLGYGGLVLSDDLKMNAIQGHFPLEFTVAQAVNAGVDVLLVTDNLEKQVMEGLVAAVKTGRVSMKNIDEAYNRIMGIKAKYGILASARKASPVRASLPKRRLKWAPGGNLLSSARLSPSSDSHP